MTCRHISDLFQANIVILPYKYFILTRSKNVVYSGRGGQAQLRGEKYQILGHAISWPKILMLYHVTRTLKQRPLRIVLILEVTTRTLPHLKCIR